MRIEDVHQRLVDRFGTEAIRELKTGVKDPWIEVAADRIGLSGGQVAGGRGDACNPRKGAQQTFVEARDELMFGVVDLGSLDDLGHEFADCSERLIELEIERR